MYISQPLRSKVPSARAALRMAVTSAWGRRVAHRHDAVRPGGDHAAVADDHGAERPPPFLTFSIDRSIALSACIARGPSFAARLVFSFSSMVEAVG